MNADAKYPNPPSPLRDRELGNQATDGQASCSMRALTAVEMQQIELKSAAELQMYLASFLHFPTLENFQRIQESSSRYITAWMNGRKRVIMD